MNHPNCYIKDYPRPQFVRDGYEILNGEWFFEFDFENVGEKEQWYKRREFSRKIIVPFAYQTKKSGIGDERHCDNVWYCRSFRSELIEGQKLILNFDGCDYHAKVWLNGVFIGEHFGAYARFSFDLTFALCEENYLVVKCEDTYDYSQPRGKQRWTDTSYSCYYVETTGIWKTVWLETVNDFYIKSVAQNVIFDNNSVRFCFELNKAEAGIVFQIEVGYEGETVAVVTSAVMEPYGEITVNLENKRKIFTFKPWSPGRPNLFDVKYKLISSGKTVDEVGSYTALIKFRTQKDVILLNYTPYQGFRFVLDQGYYDGGGLTAENEDELLADLQLIKSMGFNGIRMHEKIEDERFYYLCDVLGIFVWLEMPSMYVFRDMSVKKIVSEWLEIVGQYKNFPSIMAYVAFNESWGVFHVKENKKEQSLVSSLYYMTKALVDNKLVISNDGWEHTVSDIVSTHNYADCGSGIKNVYEDLKAFMNGEHSQNLRVRAPFAEGYEYKGQPFMISECAGIAFDSDKLKNGWGYGDTVKDEDEYFSRLKSVIEGIRSIKGCSGYCVTQFSDVMQERNGLVTMERKPKVDVEKIKQLNTMKIL